jgi:hypothetical protein
MNLCGQKKGCAHLRGTIDPARMARHPSLADFGLGYFGLGILVSEILDLRICTISEVAQSRVPLAVRNVRAGRK